MKILQYNVLEGCLDEERLRRFSDWMKRQDYDIVGLNEMNKWTNDELRAQAMEWGYDYSFLYEMKTSPYFVGVLAKTPIEVLEVAEEDPFHHGMLHVKILGIHFLISHFSPHSSDNRLQEAQAIVKRVEKFAHEPLVVMGDLNMVSAADDGFYADHAPKQESDYEAMNVLLDGGLHDVSQTEDFQYTFPTSILSRNIEKRRHRIDYILVNTVLNRKNPTGQAIHDQAVEKISDHYPIMCRWEETK